MKNTYFNTIFAISVLVFHVSMQAMKDNVIITQKGTYDESGNLIENTSKKSIITQIRKRLEALGKFDIYPNALHYYKENKDNILIDDLEHFKTKDGYVLEAIELAGFTGPSRNNIRNANENDKDEYQNQYFGEDIEAYLNAASPDEYTENRYAPEK